MKNEAYKSGQACAEKYQKQIIAVSEPFYRDQAQQNDRDRDRDSRSAGKDV